MKQHMNEMPTLMKLVLINIERINEIDRTGENQKLDQTTKTSNPSKGNCIMENVDGMDDIKHRWTKWHWWKYQLDKVDMNEIDKTCDSNDKDEIWHYG